MPEVNYLWDPIEDNVIAEFDEGGGVVAEYTTEPEQYGDVVNQHRDGETNCFYSDGLGSTTEVTDAAGDTIATRAYGAFGETMESTGGLIFPYHYLGQRGYYLDVETVNYNVRQRSYLPTIGRWESVDPLQYTESSNGFLYVLNNPATRIDLSGQLSQQLFSGTLNAIDLFRHGNPYNGPCWSYLLATEWVLTDAEKSELKGLIMQRVAITHPTDPATCDGRPLDSKMRCLIKGFKNQLECLGTDHYYEIWPVYRGKVLQDFRAVRRAVSTPGTFSTTRAKNYDFFAHPGLWVPSLGRENKDGEAFFLSFTSISADNLDQIGALFDVGARGVASAVELYSACGGGDSDALWDVLKALATGTTKKSVSKDWDCCANATRYSKMQYSIDGASKVVEPRFDANPLGLPPLLPDAAAMWRARCDCKQPKLTEKETK